jgi:hypothetical protein
LQHAHILANDFFDAIASVLNKSLIDIGDVAIAAGNDDAFRTLLDCLRKRPQALLVIFACS